MNTAQTTITTKKIMANGLLTIVKLVRLGEDEGLTTEQAAELFGITGTGLRSILKDHPELLIVRLAASQRKALKDSNVIPMKANRMVNFLPQETLEELATIINTPESKAIVKQLWAIAKDVHGNTPTYQPVDNTPKLVSVPTVSGGLSLLEETQKLLVANKGLVSAYSGVHEQCEKLVAELTRVGKVNEEQAQAIAEKSATIVVHEETIQEITYEKKQAEQQAELFKRTVVKQADNCVSMAAMKGLRGWQIYENYPNIRTMADRLRVMRGGMTGFDNSGVTTEYLKLKGLERLIQPITVGVRPYSLYNKEQIEKLEKDLEEKK